MFSIPNCMEIARPTTLMGRANTSTARSALTGGRATCTRQRRRVSYLGRNEMYAIRMDKARGVYSVHVADDNDECDNRVITRQTLGEIVDECLTLHEQGYTRLNRVDVR